MTTVSQKTTEKEISHLMRRIGFGGSKEEIDQLTNKSFDDAVDFLMDNSDENPVPTDLLRRYQIDLSDVRSVNSSGAFWMYRLAHSKFPFDDKIALFWHRVFATGQNKLIQGKVMTTQIDMFKKHGLGSFENLLIELSKDPAMIMWLDNQDNHKDNINENYGREILELLDNFDRAFGAVKPETDAEMAIEAEYKELYDSIVATFENLGVEQVKTLGTEFDYEVHQAVMQRPSDEYEEGMVCEEFQKGFKMGDTLIRAAMVAVAA